MDHQNKQTRPLKRVAIDPVTRVEGHGKVTLLLDDDNVVRQARLHIVEFRGFEKFIQGRPYWELPIVVQRLCGICPVSHHLAAAKAIDQIAGVDELSLPALKLRKLLHWGQVLQSHALHFFHLASPDLLFGFDSEVSKRNIVAVLEAYPDTALQGVKIRKYGQQVIEAIAGKRIHGIAAVAGGMNKSLTQDEVNYLQNGGVDEVISWCEGAVDLCRDLFLKNRAYHEQFATVPSHYMSLTAATGGLELYHGALRIKDKNNELLWDGFDYRNYHQLISEQVKPWSYMKFPFLNKLGADAGWYRVGPLARLNNCDFISTEKAEAKRQQFLQLAPNQVHFTLAYHWARMIEALHCAESIQQILTDPDLKSDDLMRDGQRRSEGVGVIEAPRGTLFHHYKVDENDQVTFANLIVSTTNNNQAMNESVRQVANEYLSGREVTPELLNHIEVAIRAYDPCLSCATHAVGSMPLLVELANMQGSPLDQLYRDYDGNIHQSASV